MSRGVWGSRSAIAEPLGVRGGFALGLRGGRGLSIKHGLSFWFLGEVKVGLARDVYVNFGGGCSLFSVIKLR